MADIPFIETENYFATLFTRPAQGGGWWAWVLFEARRDHSEQKTHIPGMRHRVPGVFESQEKALAQAEAYARGADAEDKVGL